MKSSLRERLERLGPVRAVSQVASGSPVVLSLRPRPNRQIKTVSATMSLARRGISLLRAKRAVEEMLATGRAVIELPKVENQTFLTAELDELGVMATSVVGPDVAV